MSVQIQILVCVVAFLGCERNTPPPPPAPAPPERVAQELGIDAAELVSPVDPPASAGDLRDELARFTTVDACVAERAKLDPLVGDALEAIGYDTFLRDACKVLEAAKARRAAGCGSIAAGGLRERCGVLVALAAGDASMCPLAESGRPAAGRVPTCLAALGRDPRVCADEVLGRGTCEALATGSVARCTGSAEQVARCRRELARVSALLPTAGVAKGEAPRGAIEVTARNGAPAATAPKADLGRVGRAGVVLAETFDGYRVELGVDATPEPSPREGGPRAKVGLVLGRGEKSAVRIEHFDLDVPGVGTFACPSARCEARATATLPSARPERSAPVELRVDATATTSAGAYAVTWSLATFVRDVVDLKPR